jgi:hypothetical protein
MEGLFEGDFNGTTQVPAAQNVLEVLAKLRTEMWTNVGIDDSPELDSLLGYLWDSRWDFLWGSQLDSWMAQHS